MTKYFELSSKEIKDLHDLSQKFPGIKFKLKMTTDGTLGIGYHMYVTAINTDGTSNLEINKQLPRNGQDIADFTQF